RFIFFSFMISLRFAQRLGEVFNDIILLRYAETLFSTMSIGIVDNISKALCQGKFFIRRC
ncbi:MAG TPA: hypothetical protein VIK19_04035, partial [Syntrophales bacterium]